MATLTLVMSSTTRNNLHAIVDVKINNTLVDGNLLVNATYNESVLTKSYQFDLLETNTLEIDYKNDSAAYDQEGAIIDDRNLIVHQITVTDNEEAIELDLNSLSNSVYLTDTLDSSTKAKKFTNGSMVLIF